MQNEILSKVYSTDETAIPRYVIKDVDGSVLHEGVEISLMNQVMQQGTPYDVNSILPDELAAVVCPGTVNPTPANAFAALHNNKAPNGFGLGESNSRSTNNWGGTQNGFQRGNTGSPDREWWHGLVCKEYGNITTNLAFKPNNGVWLSAMRGRTSDGTWREWEYINPPMTLNTEYRTTERFLGKPVYVKVINFGALPSASSRSISVSTPNKDALVRHFVVSTATNDAVDRYISAFSFYGESVSLTTNYADIGGMSAVVIVYYTKSTG